MTKLQSAISILKFVKGYTNIVGIGYSGGKDSMVVLDLAYEFGFKIKAFHLYKVPDLKAMREMIERAKRRYGIEFYFYPWLTLSSMIKHSKLQPYWAVNFDIPNVNMADIENRFRAENPEISWILYGWRASDSFSRALIMKQTHGIDRKTFRAFPIWRWSRKDVLSYLKTKKIPLPEMWGRKEQGGIDLHPEVFKILKEKYPDDYEKYLKIFPYGRVYEIKKSSAS